jgi:hypothetical protein
VGSGAELPMRRFEICPGQEAQVDFGTDAPIIDSDGKRRKTFVFRIVLSHSSKAYSEAMFLCLLPKFCPLALIKWVE